MFLAKSQKYLKMTVLKEGELKKKIDVYHSYSMNFMILLEKPSKKKHWIHEQCSLGTSMLTEHART